MSSEWVRVDSARNVTEASLLKAALQAHEIEVGTRGELLPSIAGELPLNEAQVELWVRRVDAQRAREVLAEARAPAEQLPPKTCPKCDEENPGNFDLCWKCEWPLPATTGAVASTPATEVPQRRNTNVWLGAMIVLAAAFVFMLMQQAMAAR